MSKHEYSFQADPEAETSVVLNALGFWRPPPRMPLDEWAEQYFSHAKDGKFKPFGYQREILRVMGDRRTKNVTFLKAARTGMTMMMSIGAVYYASADPLEVGLLLKTGEDCTGIAADLIDPAFNSCPETARLLATTATRDTLQHKIMGNGGTLKLLAANSPRSLRRHDIDILMLDEVDSYEITKEGNAVDLAEARTRNSLRAKRIMGSTPTREDVSQINKAWLESDQRHYFVKCPHCHGEQTITWDKIHLVGHDRETGAEVFKAAPDVTDGYFKSLSHRSATLQCAHCDEHISEKHKHDMIDGGRWVAQFPEVEDHAGFHVSTLYSEFPEATWLNLIKEFTAKRKSPDRLMTFHNTVLGLCWSDATTKLSAEELMKRSGDFSLEKIPEDVLLITAGVDIQKDRAEVMRLGWSETGQIYILDHRRIYGDPTGSQLWNALDADLRQVYQHPLGKQIGTAAASIDIGAFTSQVYLFCANKQRRGIYAIKGVGGAKPLWTESKSNNKEGAKLYNIGVDNGKLTWTQHLSIDDPTAEGYVHISGEGVEREDDTFFQQIIAEVRHIAYVKNRMVESWVPKPGVRSEGMDCAVYALAARHTLSPNWSILRDALTAKHESTKPARDAFDFSHLD